MDELGIANPVQFGGCADADDPKRPELALLLPAANVGELETTLDGFLRCLVELGFSEEVTAGSFEDFLAAVVSFCSTFDAGHCFSFEYCVVRLEVGSTSSLAWNLIVLSQKDRGRGPEPDQA